MSVEALAPSVVAKCLSLAAASCSPRDCRALRSCSKGLYTALSPLVTSAYAPDDELLVPAGMEPLCLRLLASCPNCVRLRVTPAQLSSCTVKQLRSMTSLTLISDYALYEQSFGRAQVLLSMRSLIGLQQLRHLAIQQCLAREGWESLLHLKNLEALDLSGMLEVNNKLLTVLPRIASLTSLSLPAANCHAPRMNQLTAQGLHLGLPFLKRLTALHIKRVDLEPLGFEAVKSWNPCPVAHPCIFKALANRTLPSLTSITLEGLSETVTGDTAANFMLPPGRRSLNEVSAAVDSIPSLCAPLLPDKFSCRSSSQTSKSILADAPAPGPVHQALQLLAGLPQLRYLCLGLHVQVEYGGLAGQKYSEGELESRPSDKPATHPEPSQSRVRLLVDDALVGCLTSGLTQLTGLVFRDCWHIGAPGLERIATALPGLQLLDLEGSCRTAEVHQLSVLSALSQLHTLSLARWGRAAWCPPYTYKCRLQGQEQELLHAMMGHAKTTSTPGMCAANPSAAFVPCPSNVQPQQVASQQASEVAATLWHSACASPSLHKSPPGKLPQLRRAQDGWMVSVTRRPQGPYAHCGHTLYEPSTNPTEFAPDLCDGDEGQRSTSLSYQDIDIDDFLMNTSGSRHSSSLGFRSREFMQPSKLYSCSSVVHDHGSLTSTHATFPSRQPVDALQMHSTGSRLPLHHLLLGGSGHGILHSAFASPDGRQTRPHGQAAALQGGHNEGSPCSTSTEGRVGMATKLDDGSHADHASTVRPDWQVDILLGSPYMSPVHAPGLRTTPAVIGATSACRDSSFSPPTPRAHLDALNALTIMQQQNLPGQNVAQVDNSSLEVLAGQLQQATLPSRHAPRVPIVRQVLRLSQTSHADQPAQHVTFSPHADTAASSALIHPSPVDSAADATAGMCHADDAAHDAASQLLLSHAANATDLDSAEYRSGSVFADEDAEQASPSVLAVLGMQHPLLEHLDLSAWPGLSCRELKQLAKSPVGQRLRTLRLASCHGLLAADIWSLAGMAVLQKLDISYTHIMRDQVIALPHIAQLNELVLSHCIMDWAASKAMRDLSGKHCIRVCGYVDANTSQASLASAIKRCGGNGLLPLTHNPGGQVATSDDGTRNLQFLEEANIIRKRISAGVRPVTTPGLAGCNMRLWERPLSSS